MSACSAMNKTQSSQWQSSALKCMMMETQTNDSHCKEHVQCCDRRVGAGVARLGRRAVSSCCWTPKPSRASCWTCPLQVLTPCHNLHLQKWLLSQPNVVWLGPTATLQDLCSELQTSNNGFLMLWHVTYTLAFCYSRRTQEQTDNAVLLLNHGRLCMLKDLNTQATLSAGVENCEPQTMLITARFVGVGGVMLVV